MKKLFNSIINSNPLPTMLVIAMVTGLLIVPIDNPSNWDDLSSLGWLLITISGINFFGVVLLMLIGWIVGIVEGTKIQRRKRK